MLLAPSHNIEYFWGYYPTPPGLDCDPASSCYLGRVEVLAGGFASVAAGPAVGLGRPEGGENVSLATDDVTGSKQVFKYVPRRVAWLKEKAKAAKPLKQVSVKYD